LKIDDRFLEPARPYEWAGSYSLGAGKVLLHAGEVHGHAHDHDHDHGHDHADALHEVGFIVLQAVTPGTEGIESLTGIATTSFDTVPLLVRSGEAIPPGRLCKLKWDQGGEFSLTLPEAGHWVMFLEHAPDEFGFHVHGHHPVAGSEYGSHHHESDIGSVGIVEPRELNATKLNEWLSYLLQSRGQDILRMKGILALRGEPRRYVFHGVHMIFDGKLERPWGDEPRGNRLVFIGRNLDRRELEAGLESCIA
jgi:hypothetical protein